MKTMSVKFDDAVFSEIKKISSLFNITYSDFVRNAVEKAIEEKQQDFMYRMNNVSYMAEEEETEIMEALAKLSDDDLQIVRTETVEL